jgi:hypothetical protein
VTGWICERLAQIVAQPIFLPKLLHNFYLGEKAQKMVYFCNFQKLPKANNCSLGENSTNLVTLLAT